MAKPELLRESFALTRQLSALREELEDKTSEARKLSERLNSANKEIYELLVLLAHEPEATPAADSAVQQELDRVRSDNSMLRRELETLKSTRDTIPPEDIVKPQTEAQAPISTPADKNHRVSLTQNTRADRQKPSGFGFFPPQPYLARRSSDTHRHKSAKLDPSARPPPATIATGAIISSWCISGLANTGLQQEKPEDGPAIVGAPHGPSRNKTPEEKEAEMMGFDDDVAEPSSRDLAERTTGEKRKASDESW
ncbi:MAG: hypothetical protein Q9182_000846 [Xanthomendoza sp. 2 TL-2023]